MNREPHIKSAHRDQSTDGSAVSEGEFYNLPLLTKMAVDTVLLYRNTEHLRSRGAIDVFSFSKYFGAPGFTGKMGKNTGFNSGEIADYEFVSLARHEGCSDQLR